MKKRILSILLLCCMVLTMLPAPAFAAGGAARPAATQYTYTLHYDANGGSGAPPVRARSARDIKHRSSYRTQFQPVTDIPSRVGRIARMRSRNIFVRTAIIGIAMW